MSALNHPTAHVLAVDPGLSGAIALAGQGLLFVERDFKQLSDIPKAISRLIARGPVTHVVIELVGARPGQGVCSMFSFGKSTGTAYGAIHTHQGETVGFNAPLEEVSPQKWQNFFRRELNIPRGTPFDASAIVCRLLPEHAPLVRRKKDHNTADAILMSLWKLHQL